MPETTAHIPMKAAIEDLSPEAATGRYANAPHSIAEIVAHLNFWQNWFLSRCRSERVPMAASASISWPTADADAWMGLREQFLAGIESISALSGDSNRRISPAIEFPPLGNYTVGDAVAQVATHTAYHLGQIVTLRQLMNLWPPPAGRWTW